MAGRIRIFPYNQGSRSAKALAVALGGKVLKRENSKFVQRPDDLIINWGASDSPYRGARTANQPENIRTAGNKLMCLEALLEASVSIPAFTTDRDQAVQWLNDKQISAVMCRTLLTASEGRGIVVADCPEQLVNAPLYTQYVKKKDEYRIHCLRRPGEEVSIISTQRKAKRNGAAADFRVRNLQNGFVFVRENVNPPMEVNTQAIRALEASGLAFGAVDVIWNEQQQKAYVLEINTAPGLMGQTVEDYVNALQGV